MCAHFWTEGTPHKAFKGLTLYDGTNTGTIRIDVNQSTSGDEAMRDMTLSVANAESLYINIQGAAEISKSIIKCPDYPPTTRYEGPLEAPCVIDLGSGGYFVDKNGNELTQIVAPNGFPKGVVFPSGAREQNTVT